MPPLTIIIPTHNRRGVLLGTLERLAPLPGEVDVIVVDDGSSDGTPEAVAGLVGSLPYRLELITQRPSGPAAARNRGLGAARGTAVLFLGDDTRPVSDAIERHLRFHERHPDERDAMLGRVEWSRDPEPTEFMEWLEASGVQFGFRLVEEQMRQGRVPGRYFFTSHVSVKTAFVRRLGGFDERFRAAACEDTELGRRLELAGMRLAYDREAVVEHLHPTDLDAAVARMRVVGASRALAPRTAVLEPPRQPALRHRLGAAILTAAVATGVRRDAVRRESWRYLCDEAHREGFWGVEPRARRSLRFGERLLRLASRDPAAQMPGSPGG